MVGERVVLLGVEHLEQRRGRIALERDAELVHFVEQEHRVLGAGTLHSLDDAPGHGTDVRAPVAPDVRFVASAPERDAHVPAPHRAGDRLRDGCLADTRWSDEEQNLPLGSAVVFVADRTRDTLVGCPHLEQLTHGEELEHAVLHILETVVVFVENACGLVQIQMVFTAQTPRQFDDRLEIGADDLRLHGVASRPLQPPQLAIDFLADVVGQPELLDPLAKFFHLLRAIVAEFLLNGFELFPEEHFSLSLADFLLDLGLDLFLRLHEIELSLDVDEDTTQALLDPPGLEQCLSLARGDVDVPRHQVGEPTGVLHPFEHLFDDFLGETHLQREVARSLSHLLVERDERRVFGIQREEIRRFLDDRFQVARILRVLQHGRSVFAVQQKLNATQAALNLSHTRHRPGRVQHLGLRIFDILSLGDRKDEFALALQRGFDCP